MSTRSRLVVVGALAFAGCGYANDSPPASGVMENFAARIDRDAAAAHANEARDANARAKLRADEAIRRIRDSERERRKP